jgi:hypothetical protein
MEVAAFGYPFGKDLAVNKSQYPNITISLGHITSLRKDGGVLKKIQLDASLNPGNSGGPVIDARGQVIGIVVSGITGTGINFAIPVNALYALLDRPLIFLSPTDIPLEKQREEREFTIQIVTLRPPKGRTMAELILSAGPGDRRIYPATSQDGQIFHVRAVPLPARNSVPTLLLTLKDANVEVVCQVRDQSFAIAGKPLRLHMVRRIEGNQLTLIDGQKITGAIRGLEAVETIPPY